MKQKRFRNHFSIVLERVGKWILFFLMIIWSNAEKWWEAFQPEHIAENKTTAFWMMLIVILPFVLLMIYQIIVWSKTYIGVNENAIVVERNTINKQTQTIGINHISNVNIEQNLFERIMGTCKVKLDTNTLSTANTTDVLILLKKTMAEQFKADIMEKLQQDESDLSKEKDQEEGKRKNQYEASRRDVIWNGICEISVVLLIISMVMLGAGIIGGFNSIKEIKAGQSRGISLNMILAIGFMGSSIWGIVKGFIKYVQFKVSREQDKIYLQYGLLKKVEYTVPVDKISGVVIKQTFIARLLGRYILEVINIGSSDEQGETGNRLGLACKKEKLDELLIALLPEYQEVNLSRLQKQPKSAMILEGLKCIISLLIFSMCIGIGARFFFGYSLKQLHLWIGIVWSMIFIVLALAWTFSGYESQGLYINDQYMMIATGRLGRKIQILKYEKVQYVRVNENILGHAYGIAKGRVHLLASAMHQEKEIPYCPYTELEWVLDKVIQTGKADI
ncbi:MAG: hypothetical protein E7231_16830 [Cellulosilyticum sp.]|nr:hypothetical protein [Cellulosilyticum sp.]